MAPVGRPGVPVGATNTANNNNNDITPLLGLQWITTGPKLGTVSARGLGQTENNEQPIPAVGFVVGGWPDTMFAAHNAPLSRELKIKK